MKKIAIILAGCGHLDGAEIRESIITLLELDKHDVNVSIFAPNIDQSDVVNHITGKPMNETRNVLIESARIARGQIKDTKELKPSDFNALIMPGGFGVAKNLATIASQGTKGSVSPEIKTIIQQFFKLKKPIGAICISPAIIAKALQELAIPTLTLGEHNNMLEAFGANEKICQANMIAIDNDNKLVSTPAYMLDEKLSNIAKGIENLVNQIVKMA